MEARDSAGSVGEGESRASRGKGMSDLVRPMPNKVEQLARMSISGRTRSRTPSSRILDLAASTCARQMSIGSGARGGDARPCGRANARGHDHVEAVDAAELVVVLVETGIGPGEELLAEMRSSLGSSCAVASPRARERGAPGGRKASH
jgi:hypothetical protein